MATNAFLLKGWSVTLVAGVFALSDADTVSSRALIAYVPVFTFWALDGYFLAAEKQYRELFRHVSETDPSKINFSMDASEWATGERTWLRAATSTTVFGFHGALLFVVFIFWIFFQR